jgi:hypothetical protein
VVGGDVVNLNYLGHCLINFADPSYRWIDLKRFRWTGAKEPIDILGSMIVDSHYRDLYMSPDSHEQDTETLHGPYRVAEITPASFDAVNSDTAASVVEEFCELNGCPPADSVRREIDVQVLSIIRNGECFRLRHLPGAIHECGFVLLEFRELVVIDQVQRELLLAVMAID